jgi:hypothetical protein
MKLRNEISKALGFGMTYSDKVNGNRSRCWIGTGLTEQEAIRRIVDAGIDTKRITVTTGYTSVGGRANGFVRRHYVRVTT